MPRTLRAGPYGANSLHAQLYGLMAGSGRMPLRDARRLLRRGTQLSPEPPPEAPEQAALLAALRRLDPVAARTTDVDLHRLLCLRDGTEAFVPQLERLCAQQDGDPRQSELWQVLMHCRRYGSAPWSHQLPLPGQAMDAACRQLEQVHSMSPRINLWLERIIRTSPERFVGSLSRNNSPAAPSLLQYFLVHRRDLLDREAYPDQGASLLRPLLEHPHPLCREWAAQVSGTARRR